MHFNPYGGAAAELAAALVNADPDSTADELLDLLREHDYKPLGALDDDQARDLTAWAARLSPVFDHTPDQIALVNDLLAEGAAKPYISTHDGRRPHLHFAPEHAPTPQRLRAFTAAGLAHVVCDDPGRLGRCARPGCGTVYVDTSRNGRRRFCTTRCANRVHVADHRTRTA
ncbi:CGNR zinc finger domain-containing protein [Saccharothrix luteola]|uniref:CGNR zinc finger domain-containing protein n=1 Tax=Saccharothrix luteola TaxID=2893018 RepID=UPI001E6227BA|nr:CGNR zinc finger domain-containing protein [Saccharothrix luteola]MCC8245954.1 CGNR zinc finger domain-containing protein [Saccharothrix luteola]MCC8248286.1 CGNR zinc finger domain-containing protein [Saccharothrix luteola]